MTDRPMLLLLSGPNLQLFGQREPHVYGTATLDDFVQRAAGAADRFGYDLEHVQSDAEADLVAA
ncbi:MAG TPA: type II 3-dehydroquinate dehydratase, partial [Acidimicrobiales bacterium]|nr:type II 3-dehydroquinate dehydratase [Acidimicrobiales bacterium]